MNCSHEVAEYFLTYIGGEAHVGVTHERIVRLGNGWLVRDYRSVTMEGRAGPRLVLDPEKKAVWEVDGMVTQ
jgi:hypothetical protein